MWSVITSLAKSTSTIYGTVNVAAVYPLHGANWMDYVINSGGGGTAFTRADTACVGTELGYFKCLHGGELRKFSVTGQTSCSGLTAQDSLGAFNWTCSASTNPVTFYSRGLKSGMGLKNLINSTGTGFMSNSVTVYNSSSQAVFQTPSSVWWTNTFATVPTGGTPQALSANTIYVATSNVSSNGLYINQADKVGLVTMGSYVITYIGGSTMWCQYDGSYNAGGGGTNYPVLCIGGTVGTPSRFGWIEARLNANAATAAGTINVADYVEMYRFHNSEFYGYGCFNGVSDITFNYANAHYFDQVSIHSGQANCDSGFSLGGNTTYLQVAYSNVSNSQQQYGIQGSVPQSLFYQTMFSNNISAVNNSPDHTFFVGDTFMSSQQLQVQLNTYNDMLASTVVNGGGTLGSGPWGGIATQNTPNAIANAVIANPGTGISAGGSGANKFTDVMATYATTGILVPNTGGNAPVFNGNIWVGNNTTNCSDAGSKSNITSANCARGAVAAASTTADPQSSFVGVVTTDTANQSPGMPTPTWSFTAMDWVNFQNIFRGWGFYGGTANLFTAGANAGQCSTTGTGKCQLYDYSLQSSDTLLRNHYGAWANNGVCPSSVDPTTAANVVSDYNGNTYLLSAIELMDPVLNPNGNFDGLCEGGEVCIYTPNLGAYQGTGDPTTTTPCTTGTGNGIASAVTLYAYPSN